MTGSPKTYLKHQTSGGMTGCLGKVELTLFDPSNPRCSHGTGIVTYMNGEKNPMAKMHQIVEIIQLMPHLKNMAPSVFQKKEKQTKLLEPNWNLMSPSPWNHLFLPLLCQPMVHPKNNHQTTSGLKTSKTMSICVQSAKLLPSPSSRCLKGLKDEKLGETSKKMASSSPKHCLGGQLSVDVTNSLGEVSRNAFSLVGSSLLRLIP